MNEDRETPVPNSEEELPGESGSPFPAKEPEESPGRSYGLRRWIFFLVGAVLLALLLREVLFPFAGRPYLEISHGNHVHYVPRDRNETVPVSAFPTRPPSPNERITPDGEIVTIE